MAARAVQVLVALAALLSVTACGLSPFEDRSQRPEPQAAVVPPAVPSSPAPSVAVPDRKPRPPEPVERVVEYGSGRLVGRGSARSRASIASDAAGEVTLNVVDAELREVVRMVLEDTLGANYVVDPAVEGRITVQTSEPLPAEDLVAVLDAVLRMNGAALVRTGNFYKVVPIDQALTSGPVPDVRPVPEAGRAGFGIRVVPLQFVSAPEIAELLAPLAPPGGTIQVDPERNLLLLAGSADQLATLSDLVGLFDADWLEGMSFGLFPLESVDAERLAAELEEVFGIVEEGPLAGVVRFVPIERLGALLVISSQPSYIERAEAWIERLDRRGDGEGGRVYVYPVQNGRATDLAEVLSQLFDLETAEVGAEELLAPGLEPLEMRSLGAEEEDRDAQTLQQPDQQSARRPSPPRQRAGEEATTAYGGGGDAEFQDPVRIIADATTNSLVIRASPRDYERIEAALRQLDILPLQVLIEATIAEVTLQDELRYGVEWFFRFGSNEATFSTLETGVVGPAFPGFSALFRSPDDVRVVINALESVSDVNVISSPQVLVLDNQTAQLQVGDEVPIVTRQTQRLTDVDAPILNNIEQRQTGIILSVTPRVNASGLVFMEIEQEVSDVVQFVSGGIPSPTIAERRIASTVAVQSGQTVALGGLIQDDVEEDARGVPFVSRLPVIGWLFGSTVNASERTELLVLITPRVVRNPEQARSVTDELRKRLRQVAPLRARVR